MFTKQSDTLSLRPFCSPTVCPSTNPIIAKTQLKTMKTLLVTLLKTVTRPTFRVPCALGLTLLALTLAPAAWAAQVTLTTASTSPWLIPANATTIQVEMWGGGGGGGGIKISTLKGGAGGGGGGAYAVSTVTGLTPGNTIAFSVGAAGSISRLKAAAVCRSSRAGRSRSRRASVTSYSI